MSARPQALTIDDPDKIDHFEIGAAWIVTRDRPLWSQPRIALEVSAGSLLSCSHQLTPVLMWSDLHSMSYLRLVMQDSKPILLANKNQHGIIVLGTTHQTKFIKINIEMFF